MFDFHTHTLLSDGDLLPSELARRYEEKGFKAIAITDHADQSNLKEVAKAIVDFCDSWPKKRIRVIPGVELTHLPLEQFPQAASYARHKGIKLIVAHGETLVEPVIKGTARASLNAGIDILSHPGLISKEDVQLAAKKGVFLEITARQGHCLGNGHVAQLALQYGAKICINTDAHSPCDIPCVSFLRQVGLAAGLTEKQLIKVYKDMSGLLSRIG
jgi:putative hydrolase